MLKLCMLAAVAVAIVAWAPAGAAAQHLVRPAPMPPPLLEGRVTHDGARIWFETFGSGPPVILLHGAGGDSDNFGDQVPALIASGHRVIAIDSRAQGRSTWDGRPLNYEQMATDVVAVMDALSVRKAAVVGWSDGAIISLIMAMRTPERESRVFAFSPDMDPTGLAPDWMSKPLVGEAIAWAQEDYARLSPTPGDFGRVFAAIATMANTQPNYSAADLARIHGPAIAIVDGDQEELILPSHTRYLARTIPHARLIMLKGVGHGAPIQDPDQFNAAMIHFLDGR